MDTAPDVANADQLAYWGGAVGDRWAALEAEIDGVFAPLTAALLAAAAPQAGESVLDIGCGCGAVSLAVAGEVAPAGDVTGLDLSAAMLDVARRRAAAAGMARASFIAADASRHPFAPGAADLVISRLGVMFFDDPAGAFRHIRTALKPGGRLAFVCWQTMAANDWFAVPVAAVTPLVAPQPPSDPLAPGPFAFADAERLRGLLDTAGFSRVVIEPRRLMLPLAPAGDIPGAAAFLSQVGAAARLLKEAEPSVVAQGRAAIAAAVAPYDRPDGIAMPAAIWLVMALA